MTRATGENQKVVLQLRVASDHAPGVEVHALDRVHEHLDIMRPAQHGADRTGDVRWRQRASGDLIEQRLKEVIVVAVHQGDSEALS